MAVCDYCKREMMLGVGCTVTVYDDFADGVERARVPVDEKWCRDGSCGDCAAPVGTLHHPGCDAERCPACGWQAISCECTQPGDAGDGDV